MVISHNLICVTSDFFDRKKYDWYQTDTHVVISVLYKNCKNEDVSVSMQERNVSCSLTSNYHRYQSFDAFRLLNLRNELVLP